ncbi:hypothetical protein D3C86_1906180 [compost metagenome]
MPELRLHEPQGCPVLECRRGDPASYRMRRNAFPQSSRLGDRGDDPSVALFGEAIAVAVAEDGTRFLEVDRIGQGDGSPVRLEALPCLR